MYPGGAPTSRETENFSPYSDMSMRTMACSSSKRNSASALASSVLPTPVGPRNRNEPVGRLGSLRPARERRTESATVATARFCPMMRLPSSASRLSSFSVSPCMSLPTGMPVHAEITAAMSSSVTCSFTMRGSVGASSACSASVRSRSRVLMVSYSSFDAFW